MTKHPLVHLLLLSVLLAFSESALGAVIMYKVTGTVEYGPASFEISDKVVMTFSYDTAAIGSVFNNETQDQSSYSGAAQGIGRTDIVFYVGSTTTERYRAHSTSGGVGLVNKKTSFGDSFQAGSNFPATNAPMIDGFTPAYFKVELRQNSSNLYDNVDLPNSLNLTDFNDTQGTMYLDETGSIFKSVLFSIDSIETIPEPSTSLFLLSSICTGLLCSRKRS